VATSADYHNSTVAELKGYRKIYQDDLVVIEAELTVAAEQYNSGQVNSKMARKLVEKKIHEKLAAAQEIADFDSIIADREKAA
jgi:hypothetical protein